MIPYKHIRSITITTSNNGNNSQNKDMPTKKIDYDADKKPECIRTALRNTTLQKYRLTISLTEKTSQVSMHTTVQQCNRTSFENFHDESFPVNGDESRRNNFQSFFMRYLQSSKYDFCLGGWERGLVGLCDILWGSSRNRVTALLLFSP